MRHFKTPTGDIRAIEPGQEFLIKENWEEMTADQVSEAINPTPSIETLAARQRAAIDAARDQAFAAGMPFTFHDGSEDMVQTRPEDKSNLLGIAIEARDLRDAGVADPVIEFRAASNTTYAITPSKAIEMTNAALAHVKAIYDQSWQRKDAIKDALDAEDREGIEAVTW